ncbi:urease accessory protein [Chitinophaga skermanii]|uniref:Urease accessory protein UreD n=1 Tax=Chitinophaga skermanii TaxID=331697 RepID=A0A327R3V9_9BACT|nr:urease accessory protein UreD [Chitinophaga skermanii]RAJ10895.1 urease accessory protein [Chitinophaga skermanii]
MNSALHIVIALRGTKSILQHAYVTPPFKVVPLPQYDAAMPLQLMLMSSSPGMMDGDMWDIQVTCGEHTRTKLQTQSYQRIFPAKQGAHQKAVYTLEQGAHLQYIPHPLVPHADAILHAENNIYLADDCTLVWGEVLTCGRKLNGEIFHLTSLHNETRVYHQQNIIFIDKQIIQPKRIPIHAFGQYEQYTHQASLLYFDTHQQPNLPVDTLHELLATKENIAFGVSKTARNGLVVRLLGNGAEQLFSTLQQLSTLLQAKTYA